MISIKLEGIDEVLRTLDPKHVRSAARQTLTRAANSGKKVASEEIRKVYNVKAADLNARIKSFPARMSDLTATIEITGRPMSLSYFGARQMGYSRTLSRGPNGLVSKGNRRARSRGPVQMGVSVQVLKGQPVVLRRAFMAQMKSGHIGVFHRKGSGRGIIEKNVITIPSMVQNARVMPSVAARIQERIAVEFPRQLEYFMNRER